MVRAQSGSGQPGRLGDVRRRQVDVAQDRLVRAQRPDARVLERRRSPSPSGLELGGAMARIGVSGRRRRQRALEDDQVPGRAVLAGSRRPDIRPASRRTARRWAGSRARSRGTGRPRRRAARGAAGPAGRPPRPCRRWPGRPAAAVTARVGPDAAGPRAFRRRPARRRSRRRPGPAGRAGRRGPRSGRRAPGARSGAGRTRGPGWRC